MCVCGVCAQHGLEYGIGGNCVGESVVVGEGGRQLAPVFMAERGGSKARRGRGEEVGAAFGDAEPEFVGTEEAYEAPGCALRRADFELGMMHAQGLDLIPRDELAAVRFFRQAARAGLVEAWCELGYMHAQGKGVERDMATAAACFERAQQGGDPLAMCSLAALCVEGDGVAKDERRAFDLFSRAYEGGSTTGGLNLGVMHLLGIGVLRDASKAVEVLVAVARKGEEAEGRAVAILVDVYRSGVDVPEDLRKRLRLFLQRKGAQL